MMSRIKEFFAERRNRIYIVIVAAVLVVAVFVCLLVAGVFEKDYDYKAVSGGSGSAWSQAVCEYVEDMTKWQGKDISYTQLYSDGKSVRNSIKTKGSGIGGFSMEHISRIEGDFEDITYYVDGVLYANNGSSGEKTAKSITTEGAFDEVLNKYIGSYETYISAIGADMMQRIFVKKDGNTMLYKVLFSDVQSAAILNKGATNLEMIVELFRGEAVSITLRFNREANDNVADDTASATTIVFRAFDGEIEVLDIEGYDFGELTR